MSAFEDGGSARCAGNAWKGNALRRFDGAPAWPHGPGFYTTRMLNSPAIRPHRYVMLARTQLALFLIVTWLAAGDCIAASATLDRIKSSGTITLGYRDGAAPFSARQRNGQVRGYSVELCEKIAAAVGRSLGMADLKIVWKPVDAETRIADVASRKIDAECGSTTITLSRMERVDFS